MVEDRSSQLNLGNVLVEPAIRRAVGDLGLPLGGLGLDVGCGIGQHAMMLAEALGPDGRAIGLDLNEGYVRRAGATAVREGLGHRVAVVQGSFDKLPFGNRCFDVVWCKDVFWPALTVSEPVVGLRELERVVKPAGLLALAYWSGQMLLPGYPVLEARLNAAFAARAPYLGHLAPRMHFPRALGWLQAAGLVARTARTYTIDLWPPFSAPERESLTFCFSMVWGDLEAHVSAEDWKSYLRLCDPSSDQFILDNEDYYGCITYVVFIGRVPVG